MCLNPFKGSQFQLQFHQQIRYWVKWEIICSKLVHYGTLFWYVSISKVSHVHDIITSIIYSTEYTFLGYLISHFAIYIVHVQQQCSIPEVKDFWNALIPIMYNITLIIVMLICITFTMCSIIFITVLNKVSTWYHD